MSTNVEIRVAFPDPVTGLGRVVNMLDLKVYDVFDNEIGAFTIGDVQRVDSLLLGVVYTVLFDVSDPAVTPGTYIKSVAAGVAGTETLALVNQTHWFEPQVPDATKGVLLQWQAAELPDPVAGTKTSTLYYEVERYDLRKTGVTEQTQFVADSKTLGFWTFDRTMDDSSALPADFTISGVVDYGSGKINYGAEFKGGYLTAGNPAKFQFAAGQDFSISLWVKPSPYTSTLLPVIFGKYLADDQKGYGLLLDIHPTGSNVVMFLGGLYTQKFIASAGTIDNSWHHLVYAVNRDGEATLYIDGQKDSAFDCSQLVNDVFDLYDVTVGANTNGADPLAGAVDELIVFNGCLTALDVEKLYNDELGRPVAELVGRTEYTQIVDEGVPINDLQYYQWRVYQVRSNAGQQARSTLAVLQAKDVLYTDAPLCLVEGRVRMPTDGYPGVATAKFYVAHWDRGQIVHDRIVDREEVEVPIDASGKFGAYLIQDAVVVCHIPDAHIKWRFAVPRKARASLQDMTVQKLKFRNNL